MRTGSHIKGLQNASKSRMSLSFESRPGPLLVPKLSQLCLGVVGGTVEMGDQDWATVGWIYTLWLFL